MSEHDNPASLPPVDGNLFELIPDELQEGRRRYTAAIAGALLWLAVCLDDVLFPCDLMLPHPSAALVR